VEATKADLIKKADPDRVSRSKVLEHHFTKISRNARGQAVLEWKVPSASDPGTNYDCYISVEPKQGTLFVLASAGGKVQDKMRLVKDADVRCFCTCKDFRYSGAGANLASKYDAFEDGHGDTSWTSIAPTVRDPSRKQTLCKHLISCLNGIPMNAGTIIKAARTAKFPKEYTKERGDEVNVLNRDDTEQKPYGEIKTLNYPKQEERPSGEIKIVNSGKDKKPVVDYPTEDEAIAMLGESAPVKTPEVQGALDSLATAIGKEEADRIASGGQITTIGDNGGEEEPEENESEITVLNNPDLSDPITGVEDASKLTIFNPPDDGDAEK